MIQVKYFWKSENAYIVYVSADIFFKVIINTISDQEKEKIKNANDLFLTTDFSLRNKGMIPENCYTLLIKGDNTIQLVEPSFPFSGMWNAYNPLTKVKKCQIEAYPQLKGLFYAK